ncbi:hypothetical protein M0804_010209 [Polistes exclamans]|nr:hypothetical protein M0804_010209 [Polistes exclamans]
MPFVIRKVEPRFLCRGHVPSGAAAQELPVGAELEAVANGALTGSLKQLASLLTTAEDIFAELTRELTVVAERSAQVRRRLDKTIEKQSGQEDHFGSCGKQPTGGSTTTDLSAVCDSIGRKDPTNKGIAARETSAW